MAACHDPSHGGSYVAEGAYFIRIGLPPRVVPGGLSQSISLRTYLIVILTFCARMFNVRCPVILGL